MVHSDKSEKKLPLIVAHRGAKKEAPENTAAAFHAALQFPIDGIELDVQLTKDRMPLIYHDRTMWKINGKRNRLKDYPANEVCAMDFGGWYDEKFAGEPVLTLEEAIKQFFHRTRLFVEIKSRGWDRQTGTSHILTDITIANLDRAQKAHPLKELFLLSFDRKVLKRAMLKNTKWNYILNLPSPSHCSSADFDTFANIYGFCTNINRITQSFADAVHRRGLKLLVYSCNTKRQVKMGFKLGVDVMMTDDPRWLFDLLKQEPNV